MLGPRFRLRTLLIVVAIAALGLAGWRWADRWRFCTAKARQHEATARFHRAAGDRVRAEVSGGLAVAYRQAAYRPWEPLPREFVW
jgi:hypothetical protein